MSASETTLELGAVEAIKRCHRTLREAVATIVIRPVVTDSNPTPRNDAVAVVKAITPILEALTGMPPQASVQAALKRLSSDGIIAQPRDMASAARVIVAIADRLA